MGGGALLAFLFIGTNANGQTEVIQNGGFEILEATATTGALGWETAGGGGQVATPVTISADDPHSGSYELNMEGQGTGGAGAGPVVWQDKIPISAGAVTLSFYAKGAQMDGGANPQYSVTWYDASGVSLGSSGFQSFSPLTAAYSLKTISLTAPAASDHAQLQFLLTVGAGTGDHWLVRLDDVSFVGVPPTNTASVQVDPAKAWQGYMNWFELPENGGAYVSGSPWGIADLAAVYSESVLTFTPNTSIDRDNPNDPYWWAAPGNNPNKSMDASMYVQNDGLAGKTVTFSGYCWANTLAAPYRTSAIAFIKDLNGGYAIRASATTNLSAGFFSLTLETTPGDHIQYGFEMIGPDARITNLVNLGSLIVASNAPPTGPAITTAPANASVLTGSNVTLTVVATGGSLNYQWQKNGVNLNNGGPVSGATTASLTLSNCQGADEANYSVRVYNLSGSASATNRLIVLNPAHLTVDPTAQWQGYMSVFELPENGGGYVFGQPWGTADLNAAFSGSGLTLTPNTSMDRNGPNDPFWWAAPGNHPNKTMNASMYLQNDSLAGQTLTFTGYCLSNTLVLPYRTGMTVFIKDFAPDYSSSTAATAGLTPGSAYNVTLATTAGGHIQYGFEMIGPDARLTNVVYLGSVVISATPPTLAATISGASGSLTFPTEAGINYTLQYKTNLTDAVWQTCTNFSGSGSAAVISVPANQKSGFYRLAF